MPAISSAGNALPLPSLPGRAREAPQLNPLTNPGLDHSSPTGRSRVGWMGEWVGRRMDVCMKQPGCDGDGMEEPDPRRIHWPPDFAGPQFPRWTKGTCDPFRTHNRTLTHSGLSFSRCPPGLGVRTGSHANALLVSLHGRPVGPPTEPPLVEPESRGSEPTSSPGGARPLGLRARALPGNRLLLALPLPD